MIGIICFHWKWNTMVLSHCVWLLACWGSLIPSLLYNSESWSFYIVIYNGALVPGFWDGQEILVHPCIFRRRYTKDAGSSGPWVSIKTRLRLPRVLRANIATSGERNCCYLCNRRHEAADPKPFISLSLRVCLWDEILDGKEKVWRVIMSSFYSSNLSLSSLLLQNPNSQTHPNRIHSM